MKVEDNASPRRWAPEWIAVLTLAVAIIALGGGLFTSLNAMESRLRGDLQEMREDMRLMEARVREDMGSMEGRIREDMRLMEEQIREDVREVRADVGNLRERVTRLETRFDEEFPRGAPSALEVL